LIDETKQFSFTKQGRRLFSQFSETKTVKSTKIDSCDAKKYHEDGENKGVKIQER